MFTTRHCPISDPALRLRVGEHHCTSQSVETNTRRSCNALRTSPNIPISSRLTRGETAKYTLAMLDISFGVVHALWANIVGGSLPGGDTQLPANVVRQGADPLVTQFSLQAWLSQDSPSSNFFLFQLWGHNSCLKPNFERLTLRFSRLANPMGRNYFAGGRTVRVPGSFSLRTGGHLHVLPLQAGISARSTVRQCINTLSVVCVCVCVCVCV